MFRAGPAAWSYGLAAVVFVAFAVRLALGWRGGARSRLLLATIGASALWAVASAAFSINGQAWAWQAARLADGLRLAGWFVFLLFVLTDPGAGSAAPWRAVPRWLALLLPLLVAGVALLPLGVPSGAAAPAVGDWVFAAGLGVSVLGLALAEQLYRRTPDHFRWAIKPLVFAMAGMFGYDLVAYSDALLFRYLDFDLWAARGIVAALVIPLVAVATARNTSWTIDLHVSRGMVFHSTAVLVAGVYLLAAAAGGYWIRYFGGTWGKVLQTGFLFATVMFLGLVVFSATFRSRLRVFIGKHFFSYRYDYREEWLKFTQTLSAPNPHQSIHELCVRALGALVESASGALWLRREGHFRQVARIGSGVSATKDDEPADGALARFLETTSWVVDLREREARPERYADLAIPGWLAAMPEAWLVVPLPGAAELVGFVVLARPRTPITVDWEVRDILKTAGRQAASYLAQLEATEALLEARKFDAFNRMSAFVVHDLKNLVAQLTLMLKNAERHRHNPEFQKDMLETVANVVDRMGNLMLQLRTGTTPAEKPRAVDLGEVVRRVQRAKHGERRPVVVDAAPDVHAFGHEDRLEHVIGHLVQNALDATRDGGQVTVRVRGDGAHAVVEVADDGVGMSPEFVRERLFRPFQTTKPHGMGIGVYESFQYVTGLGGRMLVDSTPGAGTTVRVLLPRRAVGGADEALREVA
ncbi:MAG: PEP-CTERM system histidine kinase PrsK [Burkholderiales bacterium]|nr:PEP-CTERM system histidine kinase PrsK [Burkholderiales bacterium]